MCRQKKCMQGLVLSGCTGAQANLSIPCLHFPQLIFLWCFVRFYGIDTAIRGVTIITISMKQILSRLAIHNHAPDKKG